MAQVLINDSTLTAIGDAIRAKNGETTLYLPSAMAEKISAIEGGGGSGEGYVPPVIKSKVSYKFSYNNWNDYIDTFGNQLTTEYLNDTSYMFYKSDDLETIPFDFNYITTTSYHNTKYMFDNCDNLKQIGALSNIRLGDAKNMFNYCRNLRYLPEVINPMTDRTDATGSFGNMFYYCHSLREIPAWWLKMRNKYGGSDSLYYYMCSYCYALDKIEDLGVSEVTMSSNNFTNSFIDCNCLAKLTFELDSEGNAKVASWRRQTIDLSIGVGWARTPSYVIEYNSGITAQKAVSTINPLYETYDAAYAALKDDPDWYTDKKDWSRYDLNSALETINSLPDTSAYLATMSDPNSYVNTIKFKDGAGASRSGFDNQRHSISDMTEEEIAVAAAKGWTVTLVA